MLSKNLSKNARTFIEILGGLSERDRIILIERFFYHRTMRVVAAGLQLTDSYIKEVEDKIIETIDTKFKTVNNPTTWKDIFKEDLTQRFIGNRSIMETHGEDILNNIEKLLTNKKII